MLWGVNLRNLKLVLEYDGTDFFGWQSQPDRRTVQQTVEQALATLLQEQVALISAGRTDTGVHALSQVANFHTETALPLDAVRKGLNSLLPKDVVVHQVEEVPPEFHSRFDAKWRRYRYRIAKRQKAICRNYLWYPNYRLNLEEMQESSRLLIGAHDFSSFCAADSGEDSHTCQVTSCYWRENQEELTFEIQANRFLHNMVRIIVGTMVEIGRGKIPPEQLREILAARDRRRAGATAPARGLCLVEVGY